MFTKILTYIGSRAIKFTQEAGRLFIMFGQTLSWIFKPPVNIRNIFQQMEAIGVNSLPVVIIMGMFTGMVLAIQTYTGFKRFSAENYMGPVVALSITRELGPVLTGLIVAGRAGAAMAAYASRAGMERFVFCPEDTPEVNVREIALQGAADPGDVTFGHRPVQAERSLEIGHGLRRCGTPEGDLGKIARQDGDCREDYERYDEKGDKA